MTDLIGGQVQLAFNNPINVIPHIRNGRLKAIAISGESRTSVLPQVPILGIDENMRNGFDGIKVHYQINANTIAEQIAALIAQSQKRSVVFDVISSPLTVKSSKLRCQSAQLPSRQREW